MDSSPTCFINNKGEIILWQFTPGNTDGREFLKDRRFTEMFF
jgi:hypothetical protein